MTDSLNPSAQALCLLTSMFGNETALVEADPAALLRSQQRPHPGPDLSVLPRCGVVRNRLYDARFPETTPSRMFALTDQGCFSFSSCVLPTSPLYLGLKEKRTKQATQKQSGEYNVV